MTCMGHGCGSTGDRCSCVRAGTMPSELLWWTETEKTKRGEEDGDDDEEEEENKQTKKKKLKRSYWPSDVKDRFFDLLCWHIYLFNNLLTGPDRPSWDLCCKRYVVPPTSPQKLGLGPNVKRLPFQGLFCPFFFYMMMFFFFFLPVILNTKCSKTGNLTWVCESWKFTTNLVPEGFLLFLVFPLSLCPTNAV